MIQASCIQKFRNKNNQIIAYRLKDTFGHVQDVYADELKQHIRNHDIEVVNLTLTEDNRLVDASTKNVKNNSFVDSSFTKVNISKDMLTDEQRFRNWAKEMYLMFKQYTDYVPISNLKRISPKYKGYLTLSKGYFDTTKYKMRVKWWFAPSSKKGLAQLQIIEPGPEVKGDHGTTQVTEYIRTTITVPLLSTKADKDTIVELKNIIDFFIHTIKIGEFTIKETKNMRDKNVDIAGYFELSKDIDGVPIKLYGGERPVTKKSFASGNNTDASSEDNETKNNHIIRGRREE